LSAQRTADFQRDIIASLEQIAEARTQVQHLPDQVHLDTAVGHVGQHVLQQGTDILPAGDANALQQPAAVLKIDGPAVVRVDHRQVPQLRSLVEIRHAGRRQFDQRLRQGVKYSESTTSDC
jgi:hypothetical protein